MYRGKKIIFPLLLLGGMKPMDPTQTAALLERKMNLVKLKKVRHPEIIAT
jgi:hypothetical protein